MISTMVWGADLVVTRSRGTECNVFYVDLAGPSSILPKGWAFLGRVKRSTVNHDISRILVKEDRECRVDGLIPVVVRTTKLEYLQSEIELLSICWCYDHEASGTEPFLLALPPDALELARQTYGTLLAPEFIKLARNAVSAFDLEIGNTLSDCDLVRFGPPDSPEWFAEVAAAAQDILDRRCREEAERKRRAEARAATEQAAKKAREASIISECMDIEGLARRYGTKIPSEVLAHLPRVPRPQAGPLTNAIIVSWFSKRRELPELDKRDNLHWPPTLRLLYWIFNGQQADVWHSLKAGGATESAAARRIERLIDKAKRELDQRPSSRRTCRIDLGWHTPRMAITFA
jgi:hypothetical protein